MAARGLKVAVFCLAVHGWLVSSDTSWDRQGPISVKQGDSLTLTCSITDITIMTLTRLVKMSGETRAILADKNHVRRPFSDVGRYEVDYEYDQTTAQGMSTLTYRDIQGEDSGNISCVATNVPQPPVTITIDVQVPVTSLEWRVLGAQGVLGEEVSDSVWLRQGEERGVVCVAVTRGSRRATSLSLHLPTDVHLPLVYNTTFASTPVIPGQRGLDVVTMTTTVSLLTMSPPIELHNRSMTCRAERTGYAAVVRRARLWVEFMPVITCPSYVHHARHGHNVRMTCDVKSNPASQVWVSYGEHERTANRVTPDTTHVTVTTQAPSAHLSQVTIDVTLASPRLFTDFFLFAENELDRASVRLEVREAGRPTDVVRIPGNNRSSDPSYEPRDAPSAPGAVNSAPSWSMSVLLLLIIALTNH